MAKAPDPEALGKIRKVVESAHKWGGDGKRPLFRKIREVLVTKHPEVLKAYGGSPDVAAAWIKNNWYYLRGQDPPPTRGKHKLSEEIDMAKQVLEGITLSAEHASMVDGVTHELYMSSETDTSSEDGLVWKDAIRTGTWQLSPSGRKSKKPLEITEAMLDEMIAAFDEGARDHVTIPLTHADQVHENTGFVKKLKKVPDPKRKGEFILRAGMEFTEPDIAEKVGRGTIANTSCGIRFNYQRTEDGKVFPTVLIHVALTNSPWINGLRPFGTGDDIAASMNDDTSEFDTYLFEHEHGLRIMNAMRGLMDALQTVLMDPMYRTDEGEDSHPSEDEVAPASNYSEDGGTSTNTFTEGGDSVMADENTDANGNVLQLSQEDLDARINAAIEADRDARKQQDDATQLELSRLRADNHDRSVREKIQTLESKGHSPAVLKIAKEILLADQDQTAMLTLSEDGNDSSLTATDIVERLLEAVPVTEGVELSMGHQRPDDAASLDDIVDREYKALFGADN